MNKSNSPPFFDIGSEGENKKVIGWRGGIDTSPRY